MAVNLNSTPYYDDFDSTKNFYRILFKPGTAVQARELTQLQTILQDQIKKFANHIFVDGSRVLKDSPVSVSINKNARSISLIADANTNDMAQYLNKFVTGETSNTIGFVTFVYDADNPTIGDPPTLVINIIKAEGEGVFGDAESLYFYDTQAAAYAKDSSALTVTTAGYNTITGSGTVEEYSDIVTVSNLTTALRSGDHLITVGAGTTDIYVVKVISPTSVLVNKNIGTTGIGLSLSFQRKSTVPTLVVGCSNGAYYKNGFFIQVPNQTIVPQKYTLFPNKSVILRYTENIINYNDDSSLLDPAFGSSNYLAPGADRLKVSLEIDSVDLTTDNKPDVTDEYVEVVRFRDGNIDFIESASDSIYAGLGQILADRTYAESGNYIVSPFKLESAGSSADDVNNKFFITPGRAFIGGYDISTTDKTQLSIPKSRTFTEETTVNIDTQYGPYVIIDAPSHGLPETANVSMRDYLECHSTTDRNAMNSSTVVGYVVPKHIQYENGYGANSTFRFYWYYYEQTSTSLIPENIRSIIGVSNGLTSIYGNSGSYAEPVFFANINSTRGIVDNKLKSYDTSAPSTLIFPTGKSHVKSVTNNKVIYRKLFKGVASSGGQVVLTVAAPDRFVGAGVLSSSVKRQYYTFVVTQKITGSYNDNIFVPLDDVEVTLNAARTELTIDFNTTLVSGIVDVMATIENDALPRRTKTLVQNQIASAVIDTADEAYSLFKSDIYSLKGIYKVGSNTYAGAYNAGTSYTSGLLVLANDVIYQSIGSSTGESVTNTTYWNKVNPESLLEYTLNDGQHDDWYDHGTIKYLGSSVPGNVITVFDYFTNTGTGAFDVQSYPASMYSTIPRYTSTTTGKVYELRDCLDYRPVRVNDTSVDPAFLDGRVSNVIYFNDYVKPNPAEVPGTEADLEYYLARMDRLYIQNRDADTAGTGNKFTRDEGVPSTNPVAPVDKTSKDVQLIATIYNPPYTASASDVQVVYNDAPRYTMKDISEIDKKLDNLETRVKKQAIDIQALNNKVFDRKGTQGNVLYTTGILVDDFTSYGPGWVASPHFTAAIDPIRAECRPAFSAIQHNLYYSTDPDVTSIGDTVVMHYTEEEFVNQNIASNYNINLNPSGIIGSNGRVTIYPPTVTSVPGGYSGASIVDRLAQAGISSVATTAVVNGLGLAGAYGSAGGAMVAVGEALAGGAFLGPAIIGALPVVAAGVVVAKALKKIFKW